MPSPSHLSTKRAKLRHAIATQTPARVNPWSPYTAVDEVRFRRDGCSFIAGDPLDGGHFCNMRRRFGSPYCDYHHNICYKKGGSS